MPRLPRINIAHCLYYITAKGNVGEKIFTDEKDYTMYLELLKKYKEQYGFRLFSFALLPDSLGLLMELGEGQTISMIMHDINSSYTKYFNSRYARKGHVFRERFKSVVAQKGPYLLTLIRHLHLAPVRAGLCGTSGEYPFSSEVCYLSPASSLDGATGRACLLDISSEISEVMRMIGELVPEKKSYLETMESITSCELEIISNKAFSQGIIGSEDFLASIKKEMEKKEKDLNAANKKLLVPAISLSLLAVAGGVAFWVAYSGKAVKEKVVYVQPVQTPIIDPALKDLDGTEWVVELKPDSSARHTYPRFDKIVFSKGAVYLTALVSSGFMSSNYSLTTQEDGTLTWETMQVSLEGDTLFWRGEERDGHMSGKFSRTNKDGSRESVTFASPGYFKVGG